MPEDTLSPGKDVGVPRPLRLVCYLDAPTPGGSSRSLTTLIAALGPHIDVTVMGTSADVVAQVAAGRPGTTTRVLTRVRNKGDVVAIAQHVQALRQLRPDILHANLDSQWSGQYGMFAGVVTRTPVLAAVHAVWPTPARVQHSLIRVLARRIDVYVGISEFVARSTETLLGLPVGRACVIYNGVSPPATVAPPHERREPVVGIVGRLAPEKGVDVAIRAMPDIPEGHLIVVGEGDERTHLESLADTLGIARRVTFAGWVEPPWAEHWSFDVLVAPSLNEGFSLVVLEALLAGIPVVAARVGGIPEMITDGDNGLLVPPGDPPALARAVNELLADPERRRVMAERGLATALERFTPAKMATQFEALYAQLVRTPR